LVLAGCATIPDQTLPQPVDLQGGGSNAAAVPVPPKGLGPLNVVRGFVENGDPTNFHAAARGYLGQSAQRTWNTNSVAPMIIINDLFSTAPTGIQVKAATATVTLHTSQVGHLGTDGSLSAPNSADAADYELTMHVVRQPDGQWRILDPPPVQLITETDFQRYYHQVFVYFFDPTQTIFVPDPRYVAADPPSGQPGRIVELLLAGPSDALKNAVSTAIPDGTSIKTNVVALPDGTIVINLRTMADQPPNVKQLMIAQMVKSLENYATSIMVQSDGVNLVSNHLNWRAADLLSYAPYTSPTLPGMVVAHSRVLSLNDATPVAGPAGNGTYDVVSAAQSMDGKELAVVTRNADGTQALRVGTVNGPPVDPVKDLTASTFTRPTWTPGDSAGDPSKALWTVAAGSVIRVALNSSGAWLASPVDASELSAYGQITDLRLSPDGVRVAAVVGNRLLVGAVVSDQNSFAVKHVQQLQPSVITGATSVAWLRQDLLVVATGQQGAPLAQVTVDGDRLDDYNQANLTSSVTAIAAASGRPMLAVDSDGIWSSTDVHDVWQPITHNQPAGSIPFYPG
jgi:hypothetical protein